MTESPLALMTDGKKLYQQGHYQEAFEKYLRAAQQGDPAAQAFIGHMYFTGEGTSQSYEEAIRWYSAAATKNYAPAQFNLGYIHYHVGQDIPRALEWYKKAASHGHMVAMWRLGKIYQQGIGTPADRAKALEYFEQAAMLGHVFAQIQLAKFLIRGHRGWTQIAKGLRLLVQGVTSAVRLSWHSVDDDRLQG